MVLAETYLKSLCLGEPPPYSLGECARLKCMLRKTITFLFMATLMSAMAQSHFPWTVHTRIDRITDENQSGMWTNSIESPTGTEFAGIHLRCYTGPLSNPSGVEVFFVSNWQLEVDHGPFSKVDVIYRFDREEPVYLDWNASTTSDGAFLPHLEIPRFSKAMATATELAVRVPGLSGDLTFVFLVTAFESALDALGCYTGPSLEPLDAGPLEN